MSECPTCGKDHGKKKMLDIKIDGDMLLEIRLIRQGLMCASQDFSVMNVPVDAPQELVDKYITAVVRVKAKLQYQEAEWWKHVLDLYGLTGEVSIDFETGDLFQYI